MSAAISQIGVDCLERWLPAGKYGARLHRPMTHADPRRTHDTDAWSDDGRGPIPVLSRIEAGMERGRPHYDDTPPATNRHSA